MTNKIKKIEINNGKLRWKSIRYVPNKKSTNDLENTRSITTIQNIKTTKEETPNTRRGNESRKPIGGR